MQTKPTHNINSRQHTDYNSLRMTQVNVSLQATLVLVLAVQIIDFKCQPSLRTTSTRVSNTDYNSLRTMQVNVSLQATLALTLAAQIIEFKCQQSLCKTSIHVSNTDHKSLRTA